MTSETADRSVSVASIGWLQEIKYCRKEWGAKVQRSVLSGSFKPRLTPTGHFRVLVAQELLLLLLLTFPEQSRTPERSCSFLLLLVGRWVVWHVWYVWSDRDEMGMC